MKLCTKNLFESSLKMIPKEKRKKYKKNQITSPLTKKVKPSKTKTNSNTNSNIKQKFFQYSNKKVNPFTLSSEKKKDSKPSKIAKISISRKNKINLQNLEYNEKDDLFEDSYINNIALTCESDTNENIIQSKGNKEIINFKNNQNELKFDKNVDLFKKSALKSTIIVDDNGNNNLDCEQKKMINNYFHNKLAINKNKCFNNFTRPRERKISTQIYKDNKKLFNKICHMKSSTIDNKIDRICNINKKLLKLSNKKPTNNKNNNLKMKKENNIEDKNKSNTINKLQSFGNELLLINCEIYDIRNDLIEDEKNSVFEKTTNFSFDSSFLGSSADDDFYQKLNY